jgi:exopolyphosphatase/guanosine-5'-triphosphate,3'-diphosphate pyrophosphatase
VRGASAILRLAEGLDRSHYGAVRDLKVLSRNGRVAIELQTQNDSALELWEARRRTELLGKLLGAEVRGESHGRKAAMESRPKKEGTPLAASP